jgi:integrase
MLEREARKISAELIRPTNQGLISIGSAVNFDHYVQTTYIPTELPLLATTTQDSYQGTYAKYLEPRFSSCCLRELTPLTLQRYFSGLVGEGVAHPSILKIRDTLSSILRSAVRYGFIVSNPMDGLVMPPNKQARRTKPTIEPAQLVNLIDFMAEPYATMVYVAIWTGLRVSELCALKWRCVHADALSIEERFCRGDWSVPKTRASAATIGVPSEVIARIERLKTLTVNVRAGRATRKYKLVKSSEPKPDDLVFQSVQNGQPMNDQNVLKRHIQPAARKLGLPFVNWRCLRTSHATWLIQSGADVKSAQALMRHSRSSTTLDIYAQTVPQSQRVAIEKLSEFARPKSLSHLSQ